MRAYSIVAVVLAFLLSWFMRRRFALVELVAGGVYAERDEDGTYRVVKVLVVDRSAYHLRFYANRFDAMPTTGDLANLTLDSPGMLDFENPAAPSAIGIGHMPIARAGVDGSKYQLLAKQSVGDEELEGYNIWKSNGEGLLF